MAPLSELVRSRVIRQRPIGWALHPKHGYTLQRIQKTSTELRRTAKGSETPPEIEPRDGGTVWREFLTCEAPNQAISIVQELLKLGRGTVLFQAWQVCAV
jgi:hypothetical protein